MSIVFVGGGNMATAIIGGLIRTGTAPGTLGVVEPRPEARAALVRDFGVIAPEDPGTLIASAEVIVLAVKPQVMREVCQNLARTIRSPLVISIAAGLRVADLSRWLGNDTRIVRSMPNTPALIGAGITGLFAPLNVDTADRTRAEHILGAVGSTFWVTAEAQMDAVTAVSGSGPAYVFHFMEALQSAAEVAGFDALTARQLAIDTTLGAARLAGQGSEPLSLLRERVTSKGGTTEAALQVLSAREFLPTLVAAVGAAEARGRELGEQLARDD